MDFLSYGELFDGNVGGLSPLSAPEKKNGSPKDVSVFPFHRDDPVTMPGTIRPLDTGLEDQFWLNGML